MDYVGECWNEKFKEKQMIWGGEPSEAAINAFSKINENKEYKHLLDLACGYGRDSNYFAANGLKVEGIDISEEAITMAQKKYKDINFVIGSILQTPYKENCFNVVYGNFVIHLFPLEDRLNIIKESHRIVKTGGVVVFSVASVEDGDYRQGLEIENNCFINSRGVAKYYYSIEEVFQEFKIFNRIEIENIEEYHTHDTPHTHKSYLIFAYKD